MSAARKPEGPEVIEEEVERRAGGIYGTIVAAGVLVAAGDPSGGAPVDAVDAGIYAVVTTVVFWLAHGFSLALARRAAGHPAASPASRSAASGRWSLRPCPCSRSWRWRPFWEPVTKRRSMQPSGEASSCLGRWASRSRDGRRYREPRPSARVLGCAALGGLLVLLKVVVH